MSGIYRNTSNETRCFKQIILVNNSFSVRQFSRLSHRAEIIIKVNNLFVFPLFCTNNLFSVLIYFL